VDARVLETARRNLALLSVGGMDARIDEIRALYREYGKLSHAEALESAQRLRERLLASGSPDIETRAFEADVTDARALELGLGGQAIDVLVADLPYGQDSQWKRLQEDEASSCSPLYQMLEALLVVTSADTLVALSCDKGQKPTHPAYRRIARFRLGKRQVVLLRPPAR
jgi:hypothetical protein